MPYAPERIRSRRASVTESADKAIFSSLSAVNIKISQYKGSNLAPLLDPLMDHTTDENQAISDLPAKPRHRTSSNKAR